MNKTYSNCKLVNIHTHKNHKPGIEIPERKSLHTRIHSNASQSLRSHMCSCLSYQTEKFLNILCAQCKAMRRANIKRGQCLSLR